LAIQHSNPSSSLADILERVLDKGIVVAGDIKISIADVDLLNIKIRLLVASVDKAKEMGIDWWQHDPYLTSRAQASPAIAAPIRAVNHEVLDDQPKSKAVDTENLTKTEGFVGHNFKAEPNIAKKEYTNIAYESNSQGSTSIDADQGMYNPEEVIDLSTKESLNDYSWAEKLNNELRQGRSSSLGKPSVGGSIEKIPKK